MNTETKETRDGDMQVRLTAAETFECGRAAQMTGETSLPEFARSQILAGARRVLEEAPAPAEAK